MDPQPFGSTERPGTLVERQASLILTIDPAKIRGVWIGDKTEIAVLLDGTVQAIIAATSDGFVWDVPMHVFGRLLDIVATADGASRLQAPVDLSTVRSVQWTHWALGPRGVAGTFEAPATDAATLPIAFVADGVRYASGFARRRPDGVFAFEVPLNKLPPGLGGLALQPAVGSLVLPPVPNAMSNRRMPEPSSRLKATR